MNSSYFKPGDILQATKRNFKKGYHPIIFVSRRSECDFIGAMITHHQNEDRNVRMDSSHFEPEYNITFDNSYLVRARLIKPEEWGPFNKIGQLTETGIMFVENQISEQPEETFAHYFARLAG